MKITAQWIAEQCGVSRGTVDRVVNGRPNVAPAVRERVQKMINEYGYKTPAQRQAARAGQSTFRIGVILPSWDAFSSAGCARASAWRSITADSMISTCWWRS